MNAQPRAREVIIGAFGAAPDAAPTVWAPQASASRSQVFLDWVRYGKSTQQDWLASLAPYVIAPPTADQIKYSKPATHPTPPRKLGAYVGTYLNAPYGDLTVSLDDSGLWFTVGPNHQHFRLHHYSGDDFYFETTGENATGLSGALFHGSHARVALLTINAWNSEKLGAFTRKSRLREAR
jgi:hypothetical protein